MSTVKALTNLDLLIATSSTLSRYLPIRIVASGGFVSLWSVLFTRMMPKKTSPVILLGVADVDTISSALGNRTTTQDLDYFIDPTAYGSMYGEIQVELRHLIHQVAKDLDFVQDWANDQVSLFLSLLRDPKDLFERSIEQGVLLYNGANLQIYAVLWLWVLVRKMKRLQMEDQLPREVDWSDCIFIARRIMDTTGRPLRKQELAEFDHTDREPPVYTDTVDLLNARVREMYNLDGFVD